MSSIVNISYASEADIPTIAHIGIAAVQSDLVRRILFTKPGDHNTAERKLATTLHEELSNPKAHIMKATLQGSEETVGYLYGYRNDGGEEDYTPSLVGGVGGAISSLLARHMRTKRKSLLGGQTHWG